MTKVSREGLASAYAAKTGVSKAEATRIVVAFSEVLQEQILANGAVGLHGIGTFKTKQTKARTGRNPKTGEAVAIQPKTALRFSAATDIKRSLNANA